MNPNTAPTFHQRLLQVPPVSAEQMESLKSLPGALIILHRAAALTFEDGRWRMQGKSGEHSISACSDLSRLNAHWRTFASHPLNQ